MMTMTMTQRGFDVVALCRDLRSHLQGLAKLLNVFISILFTAGMVPFLVDLVEKLEISNLESVTLTWNEFVRERDLARVN